jgi:hypothetical protein
MIGCTGGVLNMRNITKAVALAAMLAIPAVSFAGQAAAASKKTTAAQPAAKAEKPAKKAAAVASHTTSGTVKSISDSQLVITKGGKKAVEETFVVNASTTKTGTIDTGSKVSVHYTKDGSTMTATAISAAPAKKAATKAPKAPKK